MKRRDVWHSRQPARHPNRILSPMLNYTLAWIGFWCIGRPGLARLARLCPSVSGIICSFIHHNLLWPACRRSSPHDTIPMIRTMVYVTKWKQCNCTDSSLKLPFSLEISFVSQLACWGVRTGKLIGLTVRCILLALYLEMCAWHSLLVGCRVEFNLIPPRISSEKGTRPF